jgi:poly(3-hydroxybutyrate) depolymerase
MKDALLLNFHRTLAYHTYSFVFRFLHYIYSMKQPTLIAIFAVCLLTVAHAQNLFKTMTYGDTTRTYRIYIPSIYDSSQPVPLVMALHGLGDNANNFQGVGFNQIANTENFIAVYPNALNDPLLGAAGWNAGVNPLNNIDDVGFLNALMDTVQSGYSIDTSRVYVCGFSLGGFMTHRLACESGERITAACHIGSYLHACRCDAGAAHSWHQRPDYSIRLWGYLFCGDKPRSRFYHTILG